MDALEFLKERKRMCNLHKACIECPLERGNCGLSTGKSDEEYERIITAVEKWSKEHPRKTRQGVFLEQYPEAYVLEDGYLEMCPLEVSTAHRDADGCCSTLGRFCSDCRREFWLQEVE